MADDVLPPPPAETLEVSPLAPAAPAPAELTLAAWLDEKRIPSAHGRRLMQLHKLNDASTATAEKFAALYDATRKARV